MQIITVKIEKPEATNFILSQTHFIKTVEDIHEALVAAVPGIRFGMAFCEASGKCLVRWSGTDPEMIELAKKNAAAIAAGHSFIVVLGEGFYPLNVLNTLKAVPEVCRIFCATANPTEIVLAETEQGRGILGVVDGFSPKGVEDEGEMLREVLHGLALRLETGAAGSALGAQNRAAGRQRQVDEAVRADLDARGPVDWPGVGSRRSGAGCLHFRAALGEGEGVGLQLAVFAMHGKMETLGQKIAEHDAELRAGSAWGHGDIDLKARAVQPVGTGQLKGQAEVIGFHDEVLEARGGVMGAARIPLGRHRPLG